MKSSRSITIEEIVSLAEKRGPSDIFLKTGRQPLLKIQGEILASGLPILKNKNILSLLHQMDESAPFRLREELDIDFPYKLSKEDSPTLASLRINAFFQQGNPSVVARVVKRGVPSLKVLSLPPKVKKLIRRLLDNPSGLILVAGSTGSGKSSTMAAMIHYMATTNDSCHIITIEDPIERPFDIDGSQAIIQQRELGEDTKSFDKAVKSALRDAPDVICIGEIRDQETMRWALKASQTGHLVISSIHASGVTETIQRIVNMFPSNEKETLLSQLSDVLRGIISQRLVKRAYTFYERLVWVESFMVTPEIKESIRNESYDAIIKYIRQNEKKGMQTFDQHREDLLRFGLVEPEDLGASPEDKKRSKLIKREAGENYLPVIVDSIKKIDDFEMTRCTYFKIECDTPAPGWVLELQDKSIPIYLLEFSAIIWKPIGGNDIFSSPKMIDDLFDLIESNPEVFVDADEIWLPNFLFNDSNNEKNSHSRGCVYRIHHDLFIEAYKFNANRISEKLFLSNCKKNICQKEKEKIYFSEVETKAFRNWEKAQIDYAKKTYPKDKELALKWKDKSDNSNKKK